MSKKIKLHRTQIDEIVGTDIDYLNNGGFKEYNGNSEVSTTGKIPSYDEDGRPITTDEFGKFVAPRSYFGMRRMTYTPVREDILSAICNNKQLKEELANIIAKQIKEKLIH